MRTQQGGQIRDDDAPRTLREVGYLIKTVKEDVSDLQDDIREIRSGQKRIINWVAGMVSSLVVGGVLGWLFQK